MNTSQNFGPQSASSAGAAQANGMAGGRQIKKTLGKEDFLFLLVNQMKAQDPMNPMDNTQFTAQMAQFSTLEQLFGVNDNLKLLQQYQAAANSTQAMGMIGKEVVTNGNSVLVSNGATTPISFNLSEPAAEVKVQILDANGDVVNTLSKISAPGGSNTIEWNGKSDYGQKVNDGLYTIKVTAYDANGTVIPSDTFTSGKVTGVSFEDGHTYLMVNGNKVMLSDVREIREPKVQAVDTGTGQNQVQTGSSSQEATTARSNPVADAVAGAAGAAAKYAAAGLF